MEARSQHCMLCLRCHLHSPLVHPLLHHSRSRRTSSATDRINRISARILCPRARYSSDQPLSLAQAFLPEASPRELGVDRSPTSRRAQQSRPLILKACSVLQVGLSACIGCSAAAALVVVSGDLFLHAAPVRLQRSLSRGAFVMRCLLI